MTSVSQGLRTESSGFCVVAADSRFPETLIEPLFYLSDYRYHIQPDSEESNQNPIVYAHTVIPQHTHNIVAQNPSESTPSWHILTKITPTGNDYRNSPNRLAHHIVLSSEELVVEGPAWLLALSGFHISQWYTPPITFPFGRPIPTISTYGIPPQTCRQRIARDCLKLDPRQMSAIPHRPLNAEFVRQFIHLNEEQSTSADFPNTPCPVWEQLTGDAGWGGVLAETARRSQNAAVIFPQGLNILPLFVEALAILPAQYIWNVTFTTCSFDKNQNTTDQKNNTAENQSHKIQSHNNNTCQWNGVLANSPEAKSLENRNDILIIDLTRRSLETPEGIYVKFARTGEENDLPDENNIDAINIENKPTQTDPNTTDNNSQQKNQQNVNTTPPNQADLSNIKFDPNNNATPTTIAITNTNASTTPTPTPTPTTNTNETDSSNAQDSTQSLSPTPPLININTAPNSQPLPTAQKTNKNSLNNLLKTLSKNQFNIIYIVALICIISLFAITLDQITGAGFVQYCLGRKDNQTEIVNPNIVDPNNQQQINNPDENQNPELLAIKAKEEQKKKVADAITAMNKEQEKQAFELDNFFRKSYTFPNFLRLEIPEIKEGRIIIPQKIIFNELAKLHSFGLAVKLEWIPLKKLDNIKIETRRIQFYIGEPNEPEPKIELEIEAEQEPESEPIPKNQNEKSKLDELESNSTNRQNQMSLPESLSESLSVLTTQKNNTSIKPNFIKVNLNGDDDKLIDPDLLLPDAERFEWDVVAVKELKTKNIARANIANNTANDRKQDDQQDDQDDQIDQENQGAERIDEQVEDDGAAQNKVVEVKLFRIKLKADGLHISWMREGLEPTNFYDTLNTALGFLRFSVEYVDSNNSNDSDESGETDAERESMNNSANKFEHTVQMFEPIKSQPIYPGLIFKGETKTHNLPTPLAKGTWGYLLREFPEQFDYQLDLNLQLQPDKLKDLSKKIKKESSQSNIVELTTEKIEGKRKTSDNREEYFSLVVRFNVKADLMQLSIDDYFDADSDSLNTKIKLNDSQKKQNDREIQKIQNQLFNKSGNETDLKKRLDELEADNKKIVLNNFENESILENLPNAHKFAIDNKELHFNYEVYLRSGDNKRKLLLMTTSKE
ncbi:MAG: hypothetical protein LBQ66_02575 [Planctomycetaceae bacterium]|nr:hypothetical protein [Planctomycetaceae bacterium]